MNQAIDFNERPFVVIWENTRACDLACVHCRAAAQPRRSQFELTTEEGYKLIDQIADLGPRVFVITGGDPLKREATGGVRGEAVTRRPFFSASQQTNCHRQFSTGGRAE
jgi:MoaA/NifB/PqqE/SkfB family radical SAM enzyme